MARRVITAIFGIPVVLAALYLGGPYWLGLMFILLVLGAVESARLAFPDRGVLPEALGASLALAAGVAVFACGRDGGWPALFAGALTVVYAAWLSREALGLGRRGKAAVPMSPERRGAGSRSPAARLLAAVYPGPFFAHLALLRELGPPAVLLPLLVTWATDTAAFFGGSRFGKRRLAPDISPKKTLEGAACGLAAGVATAALAGAFTGGAPLAWAGIGAAVSIAAQFGDLVESGLKRKAGVKDSGALLPGHGGVLDRFDSLMMSGAVAYYLLLAAA